ncbi:uncharacterized protein LOC142571798 isoform X2 [Dermacentor variabilis]|uniref:uncharacterized protein LOC142571798 isoform X2 n=1 Tax=Dermacentor variabilis TaxID=34621 RepID=UPI003F5AF0BD
MMGPQQIPGPDRCPLLGVHISGRDRSPTATHGGYTPSRHGARPLNLESSSSLCEQLPTRPAEPAGTVQEFARLTPSNLARYQMYLSRTEDSGSSVEEVVRTRSGRTLRMRPTRCRLQERPRKKRHVLQSMARPLKKWLIRHREKPYPSKAEKLALALGSHMTLEQVSNWFANARRRLKNTVYVPGMNWGDRIRQYNNFISGNTEPLSISSDDSIWDSDCEQRGGDDDDRLAEEEGDSRPLQAAARESHARAELFEHSYSATALQKGQAPPGARGTAAAASTPRPKRPRCADGEPGPGGKRPRPSCDSDSPSENDSDDESTTVGAVDEPSQSAPHPTLQRRPVAGSPQAPLPVPPSGVKRRLFDSEEDSTQMSPAIKKYKTSMLLRYIGANLRDPPERETPFGVQAASKQPRQTAKRPREEQRQAARTNEPKRVVREGQRPAAKKRKCIAEPSSWHFPSTPSPVRSAANLRWTEIEAAEALTHLSQSSALCWSQQPQQQRVS